MNTNPHVRLDDIVVQQSGDETLVYDLRENKAYCLNKTSALVYKLCDGTRSTEQISDDLSSRLKTLISTDFVHLALSQLNRDGLLEEGTKDRFAGLTRREVIRKVGFASMVALPTVSSLMAPKAAVAQSCFPIGMFDCMNDMQCCSGQCISPGIPMATRCCHAGIAPPAFFPGVNFCAPVGTCPTAAECCSGLGTPTIGGMCAPGTENCTCDPYP